MIKKKLSPRPRYPYLGIPSQPEQMEMQMPSKAPHPLAFSDTTRLLLQQY